MTVAQLVGARVYAPPLVLLCGACRRGHVDPCEAEVEIELVARGLFERLVPGLGACACPCDALTRLGVAVAPVEDVDG